MITVTIHLSDSEVAEKIKNYILSNFPVHSAVVRSVLLPCIDDKPKADWHPVRVTRA